MLYCYCFESIDTRRFVGPREFDVVLGEAGHQTVGAFRFPEDGSLLSAVLGIEGLKFLVAELVQYAASSFAFGVGYDIERHVEYACAGAFRIGEHMQLADGQGGDKVKVVVEIFVGLTSDADHAVDADEGMRHDAFDVGHSFGKQLSGIASMHDLQHLVRTRLERDVEVRRKVPGTGDKVDDLVGEKVRLAGGDTDAVIGDG